MTADQTPLFAEPGARWRVVAYGPVLCLAVLVVELIGGHKTHPVTLVVLAALLAGIVSVQVLAARSHISVELTATTLRNGTETIELSTIAEVLPERDAADRRELAWESARALGELSGVPRRRTGIGLRLTDDELVQTWARDHRGLRAALTAVIQEADA